MSAHILSLRQHRATAHESRGMGDEFWADRKRLAEQRMGEFDRHQPRVRAIANATGFAEAANYFTSAAEAERAIAEAALQEMEQSFHAEQAAAQAEAIGITRKSRRHA